MPRSKLKALATHPSTDTFVHPSAIVEAGVTLGPGTKIWAFSHLMPGASVGANCVVGERVHIGTNVRIGHHCKIQNGVNLFEGVILENYVFVGPNAQTTNEKHIGLTDPGGKLHSQWELGHTIIREGAAIGANAVIVCGKKGKPIEIGRFAVIGAGAVVTKSVPDYAVVVGNPARVTGYRKP